MRSTTNLDLLFLFINLSLAHTLSSNPRTTDPALQLDDAGHSQHLSGKAPAGHATNNDIQIFKSKF